jgi:predicted phosphodiesterase
MSFLIQRFPDYSRRTLKGKRSYWAIKIREGKAEMPERPAEANQGPRLVSTWEMMHKNNEGEAEITTLHKFDHATEMTRELFVSQAGPTIIRPTRSRSKMSSGDRTALIVTDAQIWVGKDQDGDTHNFHDQQAIDIVHQINKDNKPDDIIVVGDFLDFPTLSRFKQEPAYQGTINPSLDEAHKTLAQMRADNPNANIKLLEGNHELRLRRYVNEEANKLQGVRRANTDEPSVLDLRFLLRLDELGVEYLDGYPNGRHWLNDRLKVVHGNTVKQLGKTVTNLVKNDDTSSIVGHIHRFEMAQRTIPGRNAGRLVAAASFGTLSRIDGAIPSYHSSYDSHDKPMLHIEQWQQGAGWVNYQEGDKPFDIQPITINTFDNYHTKFNGRIYEAGDGA